MSFVLMGLARALVTGTEHCPFHQAQCCGLRSCRSRTGTVSIRLEKIVDTYLGAEGDVRECGTGLKWLHADMLRHLYESLCERNTPSASTSVAVLDHLARTPAEEHLESANKVRCSAEQLRSRNSKMTQVVQEEFTGYGWPIGWHYGRADAGEMNGATIYEMHPEVAASWRSLRRGIAAVS